MPALSLDGDRATFQRGRIHPCQRFQRWHCQAALPEAARNQNWYLSFGDLSTVWRTFRARFRLRSDTLAGFGLQKQESRLDELRFDLKVTGFDFPVGHFLKPRTSQFRCLRVLEGHQHSVLSIEFAPSGSSVTTASLDRKLYRSLLRVVKALVLTSCYLLYLLLGVWV